MHFSFVALFHFVRFLDRQHLQCCISRSLFLLSQASSLLKRHLSPVRGFSCRALRGPLSGARWNQHTLREGGNHCSWGNASAGFVLKVRRLDRAFGCRRLRPPARPPLARSSGFSKKRWYRSKHTRVVAYHTRHCTHQIRGPENTQALCVVPIRTPLDCCFVVIEKKVGAYHSDEWYWSHANQPRLGASMAFPVVHCAPLLFVSDGGSGLRVHCTGLTSLSYLFRTPASSWSSTVRHRSNDALNSRISPPVYPSWIFVADARIAKITLHGSSNASTHAFPAKQRRHTT